MRTGNGRVFSFTISAVGAGLTVFAMIAMVGYAGRGVRGASAPLPKVTAVTQITHDGYRKESLLADDSEIYVTEVPGANRVIAKVSLPEANRSVVRGKLASMQALDLSPDGSRLLILSESRGAGENQFWTVPVAGGSAERVGELGGRDASWSRDGKQIVFAKGTVVYLADGAGAGAHELYRANGAAFGLRFSPDGQRIRFTVSDVEQNATTLWEVGRDGSNAHALLGKWKYKSAACCGTWTADGRYYIFQATETMPNTTSQVTTLWALAEPDKNLTDAGEPLPLTRGPTSFGNVWPARDSKTIWAIGVEPQVEIVKYEPGKNKFLPVIAGLSATDLSYSADGNWVAYVTVPDGILWRSRADGTERLQLTSAPDRAGLPVWSPDGNKIAYVSMKPGGLWKIYLVAAAGGAPQALVEESGSQIDANWSADGSQLMFASAAFDAGGMKIRILDFKTGKTTTVPGSDGLFSPRWSPDGRYIAALTPGNANLLLFDSKTKKWKKWIASSGAVNYPVWSADSNYLYFDDFVTDAEAIRRVKVGENTAEKVFEVGYIERYLGPLGPWSGRAAEGEWMFVRDRSTQEVYQLTVELP